MSTHNDEPAVVGGACEDSLVFESCRQISAFMDGGWLVIVQAEDGLNEEQTLYIAPDRVDKFITHLVKLSNNTRGL